MQKTLGRAEEASKLARALEAREVDNTQRQAEFEQHFLAAVRLAAQKNPSAVMECALERAEDRSLQFEERALQVLEIATEAKIVEGPSDDGLLHLLHTQLSFIERLAGSEGQRRIFEGDGVHVDKDQLLRGVLTENAAAIGDFLNGAVGSVEDIPILGLMDASIDVQQLGQKLESFFEEFERPQSADGKALLEVVRDSLFANLVLRQCIAHAVMEMETMRQSLKSQRNQMSALQNQLAQNYDGKQERLELIASDAKNEAQRERQKKEIAKQRFDYVFMFLKEATGNTELDLEQLHEVEFTAQAELSKSVTDITEANDDLQRKYGETLKRKNEELQRAHDEITQYREEITAVEEEFHNLRKVQA
jgi:hypothetical protein